MKNYTYVLTFCTLCLPTTHKAMDLSKALSINREKTYTEKPLTQEYCSNVQKDITQQWSLIEQRWSTFTQNQQEKLEQDNDVFEPLFPQPSPAVAITPPTPRPDIQKIRNDLEEKWPLVEKKWLEMTCAQYVQPLEQQLQELPTLKPEDIESLQSLINLRISLNNPELVTLQDKQKVLQKGLLVATTSAGLLALQQQHVVDPLIRLMYPTRNPLALAGAGLSLLDSSKKTLVTIAGISLVYIGANKVVNSFTSWLHSNCEKEKEAAITKVIERFSQDVTKLKKELSQEIAQVKEERDSNNKKISRDVQQARENAFESSLKYDKLEKEVLPRLKECETTQKHTKSEVIGIQSDIAKLRKQLFEETDKARRHNDDTLKSKLIPFKKQIEAIQDKIKLFSNNSTAVNNNEAFAILSQELQKLGEDMRQIAPSHSRRSSLAPSEIGTYTSHAPLEQNSRPVSPTNSLYSTRSEMAPRPRPLSGRSTTQRTEDFLNKIAEEHLSDKHSSPENSEVGGSRIRVLPPTPPKKETAATPEQASSSHQQPLIITTQEVTAEPTQKTPSPRRRKSICFGIFGKKEPKDTHDPRE